MFELWKYEVERHVSEIVAVTQFTQNGNENFFSVFQHFKTFSLPNLNHSRLKEYCEFMNQISSMFAYEVNLSEQQQFLQVLYTLVEFFNSLVLSQVERVYLRQMKILILFFEETEKAIE